MEGDSHLCAPMDEKGFGNDYDYSYSWLALDILKCPRKEG